MDKLLNDPEFLALHAAYTHLSSIGATETAEALRLMILRRVREAGVVAS